MFDKAIEYKGVEMKIKITDDKYIIKSAYGGEQRTYKRDGTDTTLLKVLDNYTQLLESLR